MTAESSANKFIPASEAQVRENCKALIIAKIRSGFHLELGMEPSEYEDSFGAAIEDIVNRRRGPQGALLGLTEERIPFARQLELLGVALDPRIFYGVKHYPERQPYAVWLQVLGPREGPFLNGSSYQEAAASLPNHMRPATPFEGINTDIASILARSFVSLPGGEYEMPGVITGGSTRFNTLCLDSYLGRTRVSQVRLVEMDDLVGMLVAHD